MNKRSDIDRALRVWMADGPSVMPDRVVDVVADRISVQGQRRSWRLLRRLTMSPLFKLAAAAAAVLVVAVVAWRFLPGSGGVGGEATPNPSPSATATAIPPPPTATAIPPLPDGNVTAAGTYRLRPLPITAAGLTIDAVVPEGWQGYGSWIIATTQVGPPDGVAIAFVAAEGLFGDPCHWDLDGSGSYNQPGDVEVGPTVDDLASALAGSTAYESTTPTDVTLGGFPGKQLDLELSPGISECDPDSGGTRRYVFSGAESAGFSIMGDATHSQVSIVDVDGTRLIAVLISSAGTSTEDLGAAQGILDSLVITP
jgi:hypothetical protein